MVARVQRIYQHIKDRGIKFIFSGVPPRKDKVHFNTKAKSFNSLVHNSLGSQQDVTICNNDKSSTDEQLCNCESYHTINLIEGTAST